MLFRVIFFLFMAVLPCSQAWSAPTQQRFNDWLVTCNNQNFCVTRNVGLHHGLVMTLSRSAGAVTDASLRIELRHRQSSGDARADSAAPAAGW